jgi:hypothetical protein
VTSCKGREDIPHIQLRLGVIKSQTGLLGLVRSLSGSSKEELQKHMSAEDAMRIFIDVEQEVNEEDVIPLQRSFTARGTTYTQRDSKSVCCSYAKPVDPG